MGDRGFDDEIMELELDDELDDLLGISTGAEGKRRAVGAGGGASATAAARTDDGAFLDELLG